MTCDLAGNRCCVSVGDGRGAGDDSCDMTDLSETTTDNYHSTEEEDSREIARSNGPVRSDVIYRDLNLDLPGPLKHQCSWVEAKGYVSFYQMAAEPYFRNMKRYCSAKK